MSEDQFEHSQFTDDELEDDDTVAKTPIELQGTLSKWTNYIHGWQNRYIILKEGKLSYYRNELDIAVGCRGSISVEKATITPHAFDECRFDVCLNDCAWYLRTAVPQEKHHWVDAIEQHKLCISSLKHGGSSLSLSTNCNSGKKIRELNEKLAEIETYRDIVVKQINTLQSYFDVSAKKCELSCNGIIDDLKSNMNDGDLGKEKATVSAVDFRGEALTFKATTAGILSSLSDCIEVMGKREDQYKKKLEKEIERRRKAESLLKDNCETVSGADTATKYVVMGGPDYEEGPHSVIAEEDFYDAVESALDRFEEEDNFRQRVRQKMQNTPSQPESEHHLWSEIERTTEKQLMYACEGVDNNIWQLFAEDGEMKMYKREMEEGGLVVDPLKAIHQVKGVTAHELAHHFWSPDVRYEWDTTIERMTVLEQVSEQTLVFLQVHKRVWPTAQRDAVFWSHIRQIPSTHPVHGEAHDTWFVCNKSTEHVEAPNDGKCVRLDLLVCFLCQTFLSPGSDASSVCRDDVTCRITYCSVVNPGGWAPASVLRAVYKREYPRFLKRFTKYVIDKCKDQRIAFDGLQIRDPSQYFSK